MFANTLSVHVLPQTTRYASERSSDDGSSGVGIDLVSDLTGDGARLAFFGESH